MLGTIVNTVAVILGGLIGLIAKKGLPERLSDAVFKALGLCTLYIGISGSLKGENTLILILSMVLGVLLGEALDLDKRINRLGEWLESKFQKKEGEHSIAEGFVTASLLFCVGAMTIVGALQSGLCSGLSGEHRPARGVGCAVAIGCGNRRDDVRRLGHHHWSWAEYAGHQQV